MSRSSPSRAQTEPLAALVAVLTLIVAVGVYATYAGGVLPGTTDRTPETTAIDHVWDDLRDDSRGVFPADEYDTDADAAMLEAVDQESLPYGKNVYLEVWAYDEGEPSVFVAAHFDSDGDGLRERQLASTHEDFGPPRDDGEPTETGIATRSIPVAVTPADVRGGTLHVEVW